MKGMRIPDLERKLTGAIEKGNDLLALELEKTLLRKERKEKERKRKR